MSGHMTNFTGEDMQMKVVKETSRGDAKKQREARDKDKQSSEAEQSKAEAKSTKAEQDKQDKSASAGGGEVPDGTTAEVLQWVGDDKERAQKALDKEQAEESPRVGLTGELEKTLEEEK